MISRACERSNGTQPT